MMGFFFWIVEGKLAGGPYPLLDELGLLYRQGFRVLVPLEARGDIPELENMGYQVHPIQVKDFTAPAISQLEEFNYVVKEAAGLPVLVHCLGGYGRTGTMLAAYLIKERGFSAEQAISFVRSRRPGAVEVEEQVLVLGKYEQFLNKDRTKR